jgi:glycosyltransferase involved in cell wall biosynthesis
LQGTPRPHGVVPRGFFVTSKIIINASHLGERLNGIGSYILNLLRQWTVLTSNFRFDVYLHEGAEPHVATLSFPENFSVHWISSRFFPDRDNLRRLLFSNLLAVARRRDVVFNPSQLEMTFFGARQIVTVHDLIPLLVDSRSQRRQHYFFRILVPRGLAKAAAIITGSRATQEALCSHYGVAPEKVRVIPHGVRSFSGTNKGQPAGRNRKYILFAGRLVPYRNIEGIIGAFVSIQDRIEHDLVLAGEVFYDFKVAEANDRIVVPGYVSDEELLALYRGASAFIFPSLGEGFGLPPLEAMACGCPVVASREASLPEVCQSAAVWVDPRSVESIAEGLCRVLCDEGLRAKLIREGLRRASELTWEKSAQEHLRVFEQVVG